MSARRTQTDSNPAPTDSTAAREDAAQYVPRATDEIPAVAAAKIRLDQLVSERAKLRSREQELERMIAQPSHLAGKEKADAQARALIAGEEINHDLRGPSQQELRELRRRKPVLDRAIHIQREDYNAIRSKAAHEIILREEAMPHVVTVLEWVAQAVEELQRATTARRDLLRRLEMEGVTGIPPAGALKNFPLEPNNGIGAGFARDLRDNYGIEVDL